MYSPMYKNVCILVEIIDNSRNRDVTSIILGCSNKMLKIKWI